MKREIQLSDYKKILLEMLVEIDDFCKKNKIKYFLYGGTLIGAVRHKGFIPWDDDIDIALLRDDYETLIKNFSSKNKYYKLLCLETDKMYNYPFAKIVDDRVALIEDAAGSIEMGAYIDVFPIDNCSGDTFEKACKSIDKMRLLRWMRNFKTIRFSKERLFWKNLVLFFGKVFTIFFTRRSIAKAISKKAKKDYGKKCIYVAGLVNTTYGYGEVILKKCFDETVDLPFEGHVFKAPKEFDIILRSLYGDYMQLPPKEKQKSHHAFKCWYR